MAAHGAGPERPALSPPIPWPLKRFAEALDSADADAAMDAAAADLLAAHCETVPPVGLKKIWRAFGADLRWASGPGAHGRLDVVGGRYRITVNRDQNWRRQRFTLAHELGHLVLFNALQDDPEAVRGLASAEHWAEVERLCHRAASRLLVPPARLQADLAAEPLGAGRLRHLYDRYMVSWPVLLRGIAEASGSSVSLWSRQRRHEKERYAPRLTAAYAWPRGPFLPAGMTCKHVTPDLVGRCYAGGPALAPHVAIDVRGSAVVAGSGAALPWSPPPAVPEFEGMPVPDERSRPWDVVLLVGPVAAQDAGTGP